MSEKIIGTLLDVIYLDHTREVAFYVETPNGRCQARIPRNVIATFGSRTEEEISKEMDKYVDIVKYKFLGKKISLVSDPHIEDKIQFEENTRS